MVWYAFPAYFFAGVFLVNGLPHLLHGISGDEFSSPFAKPSSKSLPITNVIWGSANILAGSILLNAVGSFQLGLNLGSLMLGLGGFVTSLALAWNFGRMRSRLPPTSRRDITERPSR